MPRTSKRASKSKASAEDAEDRVNHLEDVVSSTRNSLATFKQDTEDTLARVESNFEKQYSTLRDLMEKLLDKRQGENSKTVESDIEIEEANNSSASTSQKSLRLSNAVPGPERIVDALTYSQFKDWRRRFENYLVFQNIQSAPETQLLALLESFFDQEIADVVRLVIRVDRNDDVTAKDVLNKLELYFKERENGRLRRSQFILRKQEQGEAFRIFFREKVKLFQLTDPCTNCYDRCLADHLIESLCDSGLRKKCRKLPDTAGVADIVKLCEAEEAAISEENVCSGNISNVRNVNQSSWTNTLKKCLRCGQPWHASLRECPARDTKCDKCKRRGHYGRFCFKKDVKIVLSSEEEKTANIGCLRINSVENMLGNQQQRQILIRIRCSNDPTPAIYYKATPDTGAEACVAGEDLLLKMNVQRDKLKQSSIRLESADKSRLKCLGYMECDVTFENLSIRGVVYICSGVKELLIDRRSMIDLGIIHPEFPKPLFQCSLVKNLEVIPENPTEAECKEFRDFIIKKYNDVFGSKRTLNPMDGKPMHIFLKENVVPYAITCPRRIPFAWREQVKAELDSLVKKGVITPALESPTDFVSPLVIAIKKNGKVRITVDFTKLNHFVKRPVHPFKYPWEAISNVSNKAKYFSTMDMESGYWQILLDKQSQDLTTFLTPWGRYKFLRAPMGLVSSGDEFCRRGDEALSDIDNVEKVVDDILAYDETFPSHVGRVVKILEECRRKGITLNPDKFVFAKTKIEYVGYVIGENGIEADPKKVEAIQKYPKPSCLKELRSFMGMVNQLGSFCADISAAAGPLRDLLKVKNQFAWCSKHDEAFNNVREALVKPPVLAPFDLKLPTALHADASRLNGLGYVLLQKHGDQWRLVQCGSRFLSDTETRYAMIEIELLAIVWAIKKCKLYLLGLDEFKVYSDHKPLLPILNSYTLDMIENPRIQRLKEKLSGYNFSVEWTAGQNHLIPDALSRAPLDVPKEDELFGEDATSHINSFILQQVSLIDNTEELIRTSHLQDPLLQCLLESAANDDIYQKLAENIKKGFPEKKEDLDCSLRPFWNVRNELSHDNGLILKGCQVVIPMSSRKIVLQRLHDSHQGVERTKRRARQTVYWPNIHNDIKNMIESCEACQKVRPSLQKETYLCDPSPTLPFQDVSVDLFSCAGKKYMVYVDRLSGWPFVCHYGNKDPNTTMVTNDLRKIFGDTGVPLRLRSDNGPQYNSHEFKSFLKKWNVVHCTSTPYYPQSNGHAEAGVKAMKSLISKCMIGGKLDEHQYCAGLLEWRNTPRSDGRSPAQILFGHPIRSLVPAHHKAFAEEWQIAVDVCDKAIQSNRNKTISYYNRSAKNLKPLNVGDKVRIQDPRTKLWEKKGEVIEVGAKRNYIIKTASGRVYSRNRRFIQKYLEGEDDREI